MKQTQDKGILPYKLTLGVLKIKNLEKIEIGGCNYFDLILYSVRERNFHQPRAAAIVAANCLPKLWRLKMSVKKFKHITQKGRFELKKLANSDGKGANFNGGAFGCGIACAAMIAGVKFEKAIIDLLEDGLDIDMINWILEKYDFKVRSKPTIISRRRFKKGIKGKKRFLEAVSSKLEESKASLLIGTDDHWLLYDAKDEMIKDPDCSKPITIEKFINEYSDELFFRLHRIR